MKIRSGFVSNSSSSSFIIRAEGSFSTVKDVAEHIMQMCKWSDFTKEKMVLDGVSPDTPVYFNTGGDETYIRKFGDKIVITTTQNIDFDFDDFEIRKEELSDEFYKSFDFTDEYGEEMIHEEPDDFAYFYAKYNDFLMLGHGLYGRHAYVDNCTHCGRDFSRGFLLKNGKKICDCQIEKIKTQILRKEKINKINEN